MGVSDGQYADQSTFNAAFMARNADTSTTGKVDLNNASSSSIADIQLVINNLMISVTGTRAAPSAIAAVTGIAFTGTKYNNKWFVEGSGAAVTVTANPQIAAATNVGQIIRIQGRSATNTVTLASGNGLAMGGAVTLGLDDVIAFEWDGTNWVELFRSTNS